MWLCKFGDFDLFLRSCGDTDILILMGFFCLEVSMQELTDLCPNTGNAFNIFFIGD